MHALKNWILLFASLLFIPSSLFAASCHATGPANTGSGSGADWNNVMKLPTAPVRGDTYYLKDGSYGTYTPTTATSGTSRITIKKAQSYDYGRVSDGCSNDISAGWNAGTMGSGQAIFSGTGGTVSTTSGQGYYTFDGNGRTATAGCGISPAVNASASDCGIKIMASGTSPTTYGVLWINSTYDAGATRASGWVVRYVELAGAGDAGNTLTNSNEHTFYCRNGCNNLSIEHVYAHDSACDFMDIPYGDGVTINLSHFKQNASSSNCHGQFFLGDGDQMNNFTWSNSLIQDVQGTAYWSVLNGGQASNWNIFNNVIFQTSGSSRPGISTGTVVVINSSSYANNINVIDNTWVNAKTDYSNHFAAYCDATCTGAYQERGSLYYGIIDSQDSVSPSPVAGPGAFTNAQESYNSIINSGTVNYGYGGTGDIKATGQANPFVNWPNYNFSLTGNTANVTASLSLSSPFNVDAAGNPRPSRGVWNRGAFQFQPASTCTLVKNEPQYGYATIPGSQRNLTVHQTNCPSSLISHLVMTGDTNHAVVTFTVPDATIFTVGKTIQANNMPGYPFDEILEGASLIVQTASGTTVTAEYDNAEFLLGSSDVSGATITQISRVNWSTDAGMLSCTLNCIPVTTLTTDSTQGNITTSQPYTPYPAAGYTLTSPHQIHVTATSVDNPSSSVTYTINQAANTTKVIIMGAQYTQAFEGQDKQLWAGVLGNTDQRLTWSIVTQPSGGNGTLSNTNKRNTIFSATVPGRYKVTATSVADGTASSYEIIDVDSKTKPVWASTPADKVGPQACFQSSAMTGNLYQVGPTKTYHTLVSAMDAQIADAAVGSTIMLYNEDTTGIAPTTYNEYIQIPGFFTPDQPLNICGIADSQGHLPVISGQDAHGPSWIANNALYSLGLILTYPTTGCYNISDEAGSCGPTNIRIANVKLIDANPNFTFYKADGSTAQWGGNGIDFRTGAHLSLEGIVCILTSQCVGTYANENGGYAPLSQSPLWQESYTSQNGIANDATSHPAYMQSINGNVIDRVYIDTPVSGDQGSCIKLRGQMTVVANSYCAAGFSRGIDWIEAQDDSSYIDFIQLLVNGGFYNQGNLNLNNEAARQESMFRDYAFGNVLLSGNDHYSHDHDDNAGNIGMNARYGNLFMWYNTLPTQSPIIDTHNQYNLNYFLDQKATLANNIIWNPTSWAINDFTMTLFEMQTNVMNSSTLNNTYPIWGIGFGQLGWSRLTQLNTIGFDRPLNPHLTGNFDTDYILTATTPYGGNYQPTSGSIAIGSATSVANPMNDFAINYNAVTTPGVYVRRADTTTIGAMDPVITFSGTTFGVGHSSGNGVIR